MVVGQKIVKILFSIVSVYWLTLIGKTSSHLFPNKEGSSYLDTDQYVVSVM